MNTTNIPKRKYRIRLQNGCKYIPEVFSAGKWEALAYCSSYSDDDHIPHGCDSIEEATAKIHECHEEWLKIYEKNHIVEEFEL